MKVGRLTAAVIACAFIFTPALLGVLGVRPGEMENRALAPTPSLGKGWDALDAVVPWTTDRLPGRAGGLQAKAWLDYHVLGEVPLQRSGESATPAPRVVRGDDGYLFLGQDFTQACLQRPQFKELLRAYQRLAEIITASGRKVAFTVAPNKSSVYGDQLPRVLPRGECAQQAIVEQNAELDAMKHPSWVGVRDRLEQSAAAGTRTYWRTDTHWSTAGASVYARALAEHLDPALARRIRLHPDHLTKVGDLAALLGLTSKETPQSTRLSTGGTVRPDPRLEQFDPLQARYGMQRWTTRPAAGLIQGDTLIVGDSFAYFGIANLRPLFADGTFVWIGRIQEKDLIAEVLASDTVILEMVQRNLGMAHPLLRPAFQDKLAAALGVTAN